MVRLYEIAANHRDKVKGQSALARALNESPQTVKNWETRGISKGGAIKAQATFGCDATELLTLNFDETLEQAFQNRELVAKYPGVGQLSETGLEKPISIIGLNTEDARMKEWVSLWRSLDRAGQDEILERVKFFVAGRSPHQVGSASAVAGKK